MWTGYRFVAPTILVLLAVVAFPLGFSLVASFTRYTFLSPSFTTFAGLSNFVSSFENQYFWNSLHVTVFFVILVVSIEFLLGYGIALLLSRKIHGKIVFYFILTIPMVMSPVAVALIWKMLLHPHLGIVNFLLSKIGIPLIDWFGNPHLALLTLVLVDVWHQVSFMILMLLAGLSSLPQEPFESARMDGANGVQILLHITTPLLSPVISVAILLRTILAFRTYDLVYVLTRGGPGDSTDVISHFIYRTTFMGLDLSEASAISYVLLVVVLGIVLILFRQMVREDTP